MAYLSNDIEIGMRVGTGLGGWPGGWEVKDGKGRRRQRASPTVLYYKARTIFTTVRTQVFMTAFPQNHDFPFYQNSTQLTR
jgi:hypothetical protein